MSGFTKVEQGWRTSPFAYERPKFRLVPRNTLLCEQSEEELTGHKNKPKSTLTTFCIIQLLSTDQHGYVLGRFLGSLNDNFTYFARIGSSLEAENFVTILGLYLLYIDRK